MSESNKELEALKKQSFLDAFSELRPDLYYPEEWTDEEKDYAVEQMRPAKTRANMFSSIPLKCKGPRCSFADTCPLQKQGIAPIDKPCSIELSAIKQFAEEYMVELGVDPNNLVEVSMIRDLVDQEIQYMRKSKILAKEDLIQEMIIGISPQGEPIMSKQLHLAVDFEDKIHKRKKDLRNSLMATREARAKAGQGVLDTAQKIANVFESVREVELEKEKLLKEKLGQVHKDDYIEASSNIKAEE